jgi:hypothetical protein
MNAADTIQQVLLPRGIRFVVDETGAVGPTCLVHNTNTGEWATVGRFGNILGIGHDPDSSIIDAADNIGKLFWVGGKMITGTGVGMSFPGNDSVLEQYWAPATGDLDGPACAEAAQHRRKFKELGYAPIVDSVPLIDQRTQHDGIFVGIAHAFGLQAGQTVHRNVLFSYFIARYKNAGTRGLQKVLETSKNWEQAKRGHYRLSRLGLQRVTNPPIVLDMYGSASSKDRYWFIRKLGKYVIKVRVKNDSLTVYVDDSETPGVDAMRFLKSLGCTFRVASTDSTDGVWNWIIQDNDYQWVRLPA